MPRGDHRKNCCGRTGQICKRVGEPRPNRKTGGDGPYIPRGLAARQRWFDGNNGLDELSSQQKGSRESGYIFTRPGSQNVRKGKR